MALTTTFVSLIYVTHQMYQPIWRRAQAMQASRRLIPALCSRRPSFILPPRRPAILTGGVVPMCGAATTIKIGWFAS